MTTRRKYLLLAFPLILLFPFLGLMGILEVGVWFAVIAVWLGLFLVWGKRRELADSRATHPPTGGPA